MAPLPVGVKLVRWLFLWLGGAAALLFIGLLVFDVLRGRTPNLSLIGSGILTCALMLVGSEGLRRMRRWGAMVVCLVPMSMVLAKLLRAPHVAEIGVWTALEYMLMTLWIGIGVLPSWNKMIWLPLPFDNYSELIESSELGTKAFGSLE